VTVARRLYVLVVDDDLDFQHVVSRQLERHGHLAALAGSAEGLVERITCVPGIRPDVIVLDVVLPGPSGREALRFLAEDPRTQGIPVLLTSATSACISFDASAVHPCCRPHLKGGRAGELVAAIEGAADLGWAGCAAP
jgi:CheY-like chemotaxis protein